MVAGRNSTHASANGEQPSRRVYLPDQRPGPRTLLGANSKGNAGSSGLSSRGQSGGGSRSLAQSGGSPRTPVTGASALTRLVNGTLYRISVLSIVPKGPLLRLHR